MTLPMVATWSRSDGPHPLLGHARSVLAAHLTGRDWRSGMVDNGHPSQGCFVSLKLEQRLRGCIGTVLPQRRTLAQEVAENVVAAATRDPRFAPVESAEIPYLRISIDLLTVPEPVADVSILDARRYGVLLRANGRAGVLLPDIPGVESPDQQIEICREKAGLAQDEPYSLERFEVQRLSE